MSICKVIMINQIIDEKTVCTLYGMHTVLCIYDMA